MDYEHNYYPAQTGHQLQRPQQTMQHQQHHQDLSHHQQQTPLSSQHHQYQQQQQSQQLHHQHHQHNIPQQQQQIIGGSQQQMQMQQHHLHLHSNNNNNQNFMVSNSLMTTNTPLNGGPPLTTTPHYIQQNSNHISPIGTPHSSSSSPHHSIQQTSPSIQAMHQQHVRVQPTPTPPHYMQQQNNLHLSGQQPISASQNNHTLHSVQQQQSSPNSMQPMHHSQHHHNIHQQHHLISSSTPPQSAYKPHNNVNNSGNHMNNQNNNQHHSYDSRSSPFYQNISQTEFRIIEFNKRLQKRPKFNCPSSPLPIVGSADESCWWENFVSDFFDDNATLTLRISPDDKPVEYTIGKTLIPRFFKSYFDGGVVDLSIKIKNARETAGNGQLIMLECDQTDITSKYNFKHSSMNMPMNIVVHTEGHLSLEFFNNNFNDTLLIKSWKFYTNQCHEYVDRSVTSFLVEPITKHGLTTSTISYLKMCMIMEPMQELMLHYKETKMDPRSCLKHLLFNKFKIKSFDDINKQQPKKRGKRKPSANSNTSSSCNKKVKGFVNNSSNNNNNSNSNNNNNDFTSTSSNRQAPNFSLTNQDILIVGEPTLLGADFEDENVRHATKHENAQYDIKLNEGNLSADNSTNNNDIIESNNQVTSNEFISEAKVVEQKQEVKQEEKDRKEEGQEIQNHDKGSDQAEKSEENEMNKMTTTNEELLNSQSYQKDVMVVGEPSLLHTDFEDENVRHTAKLENDQYELDSVIEQLSNSNSTEINGSSSQPESGTGTSNELDQIIEQQGPQQQQLQLDEKTAETTDERDESTTSKFNQCDSLTSKQSKQIPNSNTSSCNNNKSALTSLKQNRRRSSERKETLREGLMRTSDFVVAMKDLKCEHPALWRITTGNNLLQQFEPKTKDGIVLYENTNQYAGWNPEIRKDYVGVDVKLTQHTRNQITVERLLLNFQKLEDADSFYDKHFIIYLQIIISTALDSRFWESIEKEPEHHDYFLTSRRIVDDITKQMKLKLSNKLQLAETTMKNIEKYPNLIFNQINNNHKDELCRACNIHLGTQILSFENTSYDLHSFKPVKVSIESTKTEENNLCENCIDIVKLYSEIHHFGWKLYNLSREKIEQHRTKGKLINEVLDDSLKDEKWVSSVSVRLF